TAGKSIIRGNPSTILICFLESSIINRAQKHRSRLQTLNIHEISIQCNNTLTVTLIHKNILILQVSYIPGYPGIHYVAEDNHKLLILSPLPKYCD
ncbi:hypothetical protein STEG23_027766, partial [Scotinomys teguina]